MRIKRIDVQGFGSLRDRTFELGGALTVFFGRNEAGKSTLMNLIRYLLFGFPPRFSGSRYEPQGGGAHGGSLTLAEASAGREWRIERFEGRTGAGRGRIAGSTPRVTLDDGTTGGEELLRAKLSGLNGELYRNLFAFGLTELQELRTLQADDISAYLYGAGFGASGAAIREAERRLQQRMEELFRPRGKNQEIAATLKAIDELDAALRKSREDASRYEARRAELAELDEALSRLMGRSEEVRARAGWLAQCLKARPSWLALRGLERELSALPALQAFPEAAVSRWETLAAEHEALLAECERLQLRRGRAEERLIAQPPAGDAAGRLALLQLLERAPLFERGEREALQLSGERRQLQQRLAGLLRALDASWDAEALRAVPVTVALREQIRGFRSRLGALAAERERLEAELAQAAQRAADARDELRRAEQEAEETLTGASAFVWPLDGPLRPEDEPMQLLRHIRRDYAEWQRLGAELTHVRERAEAERRHLEQLQRALAAGPRMGRERPSAALPITLLLLSAALGAWLFVTGQRAAALTAGVVLAGLALLQLSRAGRVPRNRQTAGSGRGGRGQENNAQWGTPLDTDAGGGTAKPEQDAFDERMAVLSGQLRQLQRRLLEHVRRLTASPESAAAVETARDLAGGLSSAASWEAVREWLEGSLGDWERRAERWRQEREALLRRRERLAELQAGAERTLEQRRLAERRLEGLAVRRAPELEAWRSLLYEHRLPPGLSPDSALEVLQLIEQGHELLAQDAALSSTVAALRADSVAYRAEVAERLELDPDADVTAALRGWKEADELEQARLAECKRTAEELAETLHELEVLELQIGRVEHRRQELLCAACALDEQELRMNARLHERRRQLEEERKTVSATLEAWVGERSAERLDAELLGQEEEALERELQQLKDELGRFQLEEEQLRDRRGRLTGELDKLETGSEHAERLQQRQELAGQLQRQAEEWAELALAAALMRRTRELFERDKQPQVLQRASTYFARMTDGRYARIVAPLGEQRLLAMLPDGEALEPAKLSRGTAEQMYLAMRFAIAAETMRDTPPPLILDDILVNFDELRMKRALELTAELAKTHQVLLFTCHPHIVKAVEASMPHHERVDL